MPRMLKRTPAAGDDMDSVFYEVQMLNCAFQNISGADQVATNAFLESFLLHARNLLNFFKDPQWPDDLTFNDFTDSHGKPLSLMPVNVDADVIILDQQTFAASDKKRSVTKITWISDRLLQAINRSMSDFLNQAADSYFPTTNRITKAQFRNEFFWPSSRWSAQTTSGIWSVITSNP
jgi:hypothetical protein